MHNEKLIINKDWLIKLHDNNVVLSKNGIAIIEGIKDYYDLLDALSSYLNNRSKKQRTKKYQMSSFRRPQ